MNITTKKIPFSYAKRHSVCMGSINDDFITIYYTAKTKKAILSELRRFLNQPIKIELLSKEEMQNILAKSYALNDSTKLDLDINIEEDLELQQLAKQLPKAEELLDTKDDAPIIRLINALFTQAIKQQASDIHIETFEENVTIRYRIDGILTKVLEPPRVLAPLLVSRIKVMAKLNIAEKRLPQDGRITLHIAGRPVDIRVSTLPSTHGERVVLRILDKQAAHLDLSTLGMSAENLKLMKQLIHNPHGIILVTGPTGSGKTTTLYAALTSLNEPTRNILTVEDPIEYDLPGIGQTQVNPKINLTFASGLRSILRQDPDIVMVGEIRDFETAQIAVQASLTGHLVLSTLHTNSAIGAITRLRDMGAQPFLLASTLIGVVAQRLVRLLCPKCKYGKNATTSECELLGIKDQAPILYHPKGCEACNQTGYRGRSGIYELIVIDKNLQNMIHDNQSELNLMNYARKITPSISSDGFSKAISGQTSLEEVLRVIA